MTRVTFHFGAEDKWHYASRLLRKATQSGARVAVVANPRDLSRVDTDLWALSPTEFVPHCLCDAPQSIVNRSAAVLFPSDHKLKSDREVLLNLAEEIPVDFASYERLIEVVSTDETERHQARGRWKHYAALGVTIEKHDIQRKETR